MIPLDQLEALCNRARVGRGAASPTRYLPVETALDEQSRHWPSHGPDCGRLHSGPGRFVGRGTGMRPNSSGTVYVTWAGRLLALAEIGNGELIPKRVFQT